MSCEFGLGGGNVRLRHSGRPNGSEVNPRGQGPRAEADAAHGVHACKSRDAGRAPPPVLILTSRLGRRTGAGPRRVLPRVSRRDFDQFTLLHFCQCDKDMRQERAKIANAVANAQQQHDSDANLGKILLFFKSTIRCEQNIEPSAHCRTK